MVLSVSQFFGPILPPPITPVPLLMEEGVFKEQFILKEFGAVNRSLLSQHDRENNIPVHYV